MEKGCAELRGLMGSLSLREHRQMAGRWDEWPSQRREWGQGHRNGKGHGVVKIEKCVGNQALSPSCSVSHFSKCCQVTDTVRTTCLSDHHTCSMHIHSLSYATAHSILQKLTTESLPSPLTVCGARSAIYCSSWLRLLHTAQSKIGKQLKRERVPSWETMSMSNPEKKIAKLRP